jgi:phage/plasmid-associated DNA primase
MWNMQCNDIPDMDSTDHGTWRRIHVINYPSRFVDGKSEMLNDPEKYPHHYAEDSTIKDKLEKWAPYFLVMLFNRYQDLKKENFRSLSDEYIPTPVKEATERYKQIANVYELFAKEHTVDNPGYKQSVNDVWAEFVRYTQSVNHPNKVSKKQFDVQIKRFMGDPRTIGRDLVFVDRTLRNQGEPINSVSGSGSKAITSAAPPATPSK